MVLLGASRVRVGGRYALAEAIREGEQGALFGAKDERTGKEVRVAILKADAPDELRLRFKARAEALTKIRHPNLERVLAVGEEGGRIYAVAEEVEGPSLGEHLREGPALNVEEAVRALAEVLGGLDKLHKEELSHGGLALDPVGSHLLLSPARGRVVPKLAGFLFTGGLREPPEDGPAEDRRALAALAYALLVGRLPAEGAALRPIGEARPSLKGPLATAIEKELSGDPRRRHKDTPTFQRALRTATILARGLKEERTELLEEAEEASPPAPPPAPPPASPPASEAPPAEALEIEEELGGEEELGAEEELEIEEELGGEEELGAEEELEIEVEAPAPEPARAPPPPPPPPPPRPGLGASSDIVTVDAAKEVAEEIDLSINDEPSSFPPAPEAAGGALAQEAPALPEAAAAFPAPAPGPERSQRVSDRPKRVSEHPAIASEPPPVSALWAASLPGSPAGAQAGGAPSEEPKGSSMALWGLLGFLLFGAAGGLGAWLYLGGSGGETHTPEARTPEASAPEASAPASAEPATEPTAQAPAPASAQAEGPEEAGAAAPEEAPAAEGDSEEEAEAEEDSESGPESEEDSGSESDGELDSDHVRVTFLDLPEEARVTIDDRRIHSASATLRRTSRSRQIRIRARGYHSFRRTVPGDESMEIRLDMERR